MSAQHPNLFFSGAVLRKFPNDNFPDARSQAKKAANKAGLNAKQRLESKGKYSEDAKGKKKELYQNKKQDKKSKLNLALTQKSVAFYFVYSMV